jgi:lipoate-protein ligase A
MHGEYKTPGGKLVVSDLNIRDGKLTDVVISGDFFLEPPEALSQINQSIENLDASATEEEIAERVRSALSDGVEMIGFSPEAIAIAVRRAVG